MQPESGLPCLAYMKGRLFKIGLCASVLVATFIFFELLVGFINWGQEFGAMGQYNRVAHVIEDMNGYSSEGNRLNRELTLKDLGHLNFFLYKVKTPIGQTVEVRFDHGSPFYEEKNKDNLRQIILQKIGSQL